MLALLEFVMIDHEVIPLELVMEDVVDVDNLALLPRILPVRIGTLRRSNERRAAIDNVSPRLPRERLFDFTPCCQTSSTPESQRTEHDIVLKTLRSLDVGRVRAYKVRRRCIICRNNLVFVPDITIANYVTPSRFYTLPRQRAHRA